MGKLQKNQSGFAALEAVLILVIVGILGFTGWFVWHVKQNTDKSLTTNNSTVPTYKKQTKKSTPQATVSNVALGRQDYSFTAPEGWKYVQSQSGLGDVYEDTDGNQIVVAEDLSYDKNVRADYVWQADPDTSKGIKIVTKSQACNPEHSSNFSAAYTTFEGFQYACDEDASKSIIVVFVAAQGGEIHLGNHIYRLEYTSTSNPHLEQYETILGTFSAK